MAIFFNRLDETGLHNLSSALHPKSPSFLKRLIDPEIQALHWSIVISRGSLHQGKQIILTCKGLFSKMRNHRNPNFGETTISLSSAAEASLLLIIDVKADKICGQISVANRMP